MTGVIRPISEPEILHAQKVVDFSEQRDVRRGELPLTGGSEK
jgi:hypothetical protein